MASTRLYRTFGAGNRDKWTFSAWLKWDGFGGDTKVFSSYVDASNYGHIQFTGYTLSYQGAPSAGTLTTNRVFRDPTAWYNIQVIYDSGNATSGDRIQMWVNGVRETSFSTETYPSQDQDGVINSAQVHAIGARGDASQYWGGEMSHVHFADGQAYPASTFGEIDATSGIWVAKTSPTVTYGTNGFFLKFASGASGTDSSGETNDFTVSGNLTNTKDNPDNNFCTGSPLNYQSSGGNIIYTNGNNTIYNSGNTWRSAYSTLGDNTGKYYFETKWVGSDSNWWVGIVDASQMSETAAKFVAATRGYGTNSSGHRGNSGSEVSWAGDVTYSQNDIVMIAFDMTNNFIYFGRNGTWANSGDPTSGASGTGAPYAITADKFYIPAYSLYSANAGLSANFGNGYFGTTAVTSEGTNASGNGKFEYDVPTGYTALCTKGLNT
tara:strand:+ start:308 stop:1615 length:1308 start_codon:yes stop_codon:yes gene_type:complete